MVIQFPGGSYSNELQDNAKKNPATDDQCDRILQSVLTSVGNTDHVSYTKAAAAVENMASNNISKTVNRVIATGTGAALLAAGLFLVISTNNKREVPGGIVIMDPDVPLSEAPMIEAVVPEGTQWDVPSIVECRVEDGFILIVFDIPFEEFMEYKFYGVSETGDHVEPEEVDAESKLIKFRLPDERLEVYIENGGGDRAKTAIDPA